MIHHSLESQVHPSAAEAINGTSGKGYLVFAMPCRNPEEMPIDFPTQPLRINQRFGVLAATGTSRRNPHSGTAVGHRPLDFPSLLGQLAQMMIMNIRNLDRLSYAQMNLSAAIFLRQLGRLGELRRFHHASRTS